MIKPLAAIFHAIILGSFCLGSAQLAASGAGQTPTLAAANASSETIALAQNASNPPKNNVAQSPGVITASTAQGGLDDLLPVEEAFVPDVQVTGANGEQVTLSIKIADGYYLYKERMSLEAVRPEDVVIGKLALPEGEKKVDEFFGEQHVFHQDISAVAPLRFPNGKPNVVAFKFKYQGCADAGICYPPQLRTYAMDLPGETVSGLTSSATDGNANNAQYVVNSDATANPTSPTAVDDAAIPGQNNAPTQITALDSANSAAPMVDAVPNANQDPLGLSTPSTITPTAPAGGLTMMSQDALPEAEAFKVEALATDGNTILMRITAPNDYYVYQDKFVFASSSDGMAISPKFPPARKIKDEHFGDVLVHFGLSEIPLELTRTSAAPEQTKLTVQFQGCKENSVCYPVMQRDIMVDLPAAIKVADAVPAVAAADSKASAPNNAPANPASSVGLITALLLALGGGLILNLMPCVLPVLSLKVMGLVESGVSRQAARSQALWYTIGVLASFLLLGILLLSLRSAGQALGWGFQLQNPWVVGLLAYLMLAMGLSLSGVFSFGNNLGNLGASLADSGGAKGAFFTGVLAAVVASPCTAPMMGTALGYAFTQPAVVSLIVLLALGLGLALPFLLIGFVPALAARLPRPGAWMEVLKQWLAVPLYATVIWLLWILGNQTGVTGMAYALLGALLLAVGLWWWDRQRYSTADSTALSKAVAAVFVLVSFWPLAEAVAMRDSVKHNQSQAPDSAERVSYSDEKIAQIRANNRAILLDMTADWCITCKVNEKRAINTYKVGQLMQQTQTVYMVGDFTNPDPAISAYLKSFGAVGVPLYVVYPKNGGQPFVLPQLLSEQIVLDAINKANQ